MTKLISVVFAHLLSLGAVWRLYLSLPTTEPNLWLWNIGAPIISLVLILVVIWEIYNYWDSEPTKFRWFKQWQIKRYMRRWLGSGGRAVIFTRDMSWVDD